MLAMWQTHHGNCDCSCVTRGLLVVPMVQSNNNGTVVIVHHTSAGTTYHEDFLPWPGAVWNIHVNGKH